MKITEINMQSLTEQPIVYEFFQQGARISDVAGGGDMEKSVYDPTTIEGDAFSMANMVETALRKILTDLERTAISNNSAKVSFPEAPEDGTPYARQDAGWVAAGGGGGGLWEVVETQEVTGSPVAEILFETLNFGTHIYRLSGQLNNNDISTNIYQWFAREANAAAVDTGDYLANRSHLLTSLNDNQLGGNYLTRLSGNSLWQLNIDCIIFKKDGSGLYTYNVVKGVATSQTILTLLAHTAALDTVDSSPTKFGIYHPSASVISVGTKLTLERRAL